MDKHPKETIEQLMNEKDEQKIVQQAEYNP
jgi:hypothetical protein